jgi:hypothetical protein
VSLTARKRHRAQIVGDDVLSANLLDSAYIRGSKAKERRREEREKARKACNTRGFNVSRFLRQVEEDSGGSQVESGDDVESSQCLKKLPCTKTLNL